MAGIVVVGGGMAGLTTSLLLADEGHAVTVLERDPAPPPSPQQAWDEWERRGVAQFRLLHFFPPRFCRELDAHLPTVTKALDDAGALRFNPMALAPESMTGARRDDDGDYEALTGRRPVVEAATASVLAAHPGITVRRGCAVAGLLTESGAAAGPPHIIGVRTTDGDDLHADLVVDTSGRRSALPGWLEAAGATPPAEDIDDVGFVYFGRHFRSADGSIPPLLGPLLQSFGSFSVLALPADNGTWGLGIIASAKDAALRPLRDAERWTRVIQRCDLLAHWLEGQPLDDDIAVMAKLEDRRRDFCPAGTPVASGIAAVGDSWACTNPSVGRGATMGLLHALALRSLVRERGLERPDAVEFARAWHQATQDAVDPWLRETQRGDRHRLAEIEAHVRGEPYRTDDGWWAETLALASASSADPACFRALLANVGMLRRMDDILADPAVRPSIDAGVADAAEGPPPPVMFGPSRTDILAVCGTGGAT